MVEPLFLNFQFLFSRRGQALRRGSGQAALSLVFLIGGIMVLIGVTLAFLVISFINASMGFQSANRALAVASGGVYDALLQLDRSMTFSGTYTVPLGAYTATVTVTNDQAAGKATIDSSSIVSAHQRKIRATVSIATSSGQITLISWETLVL